MKIQREWATPLTTGAFGLVAVTGVLMFFHLDSGLNKTAHEWLGWVMLAGAGLHLTANLAAFRRYLASTRARAVMGLFAALLALSFVPLGGAGGQPPFVAPMQALAAAPLSTLATVAKVSPAQMRQRLAAAGLAPPGEDGPVPGLAGAEARRQMRLLNTLLAPS